MLTKGNQRVNTPKEIFGKPAQNFSWATLTRLPVSQCHYLIFGIVTLKPDGLGPPLSKSGYPAHRFPSAATTPRNIYFTPAYIQFMQSTCGFTPRIANIQPPDRQQEVRARARHMAGRPTLPAARGPRAYARVPHGTQRGPPCHGPCLRSRLLLASAQHQLLCRPQAIMSDSSAFSTSALFLLRFFLATARNALGYVLPFTLSVQSSLYSYSYIESRVTS